MNNSKVFAVCFILLSLIGCAFTAQTVRIRPALSVEENNVGQGKNIYIDIVDKRSSNIVGHRTAIKSMSARIMTSEDLGQELQKIFEDNFRKKGFIPISDESELTQFILKINTIDHVISMGLIELGINTVVSMEVYAKNNDQKYHENYYSELKTGQPVTPSAKFNEEFVNHAISENIMKIFNDQKLLKFLAQ